VPFQGELVEAGVARVEDPPPLHLSRPDRKDRIHLAVDHHQVTLLAVHVVRHHGIRRWEPIAQAQVLQHHDMGLETGKRGRFVLDDQRPGQSPPVLLRHHTMDMGVIEVQVPRFLHGKVIGIVVDLPRLKLDHHAVGRLQRGNMEAVGVEIGDVLRMPEDVRFRRIREEIFQLNLQFFPLSRPDGRTGESAKILIIIVIT